jgi:very-short-patch-repair endonuclease
LDPAQNEVERMLFIEGMSLKEIAKEYGLSTPQLTKFCNDWGLTKEIRKRGLRSHPQVILKRLILQLYPDTPVRSEYHVGERLSLDFYLPQYHLAFEYDGIQHTEYVDFYHKDAEGFQKSQKRDKRKEEICSALGIVLVRLGPSDALTIEHLMSLIKTALYANGTEESPELPYREKIKRLSRDAKRARMRALYKASKEWKKENKGG